MGVILVIHLLVIVGGLRSVLAEINFRQCTMKRERGTEDSFVEKFSKILKKTKFTKLGCARLCCEDDRCVGMLVCPAVCHLFGVFDVTQSIAPRAQYNSCDVYNVNRCDNKGFPDKNGYCRCTRGYGGPFCDTVVQDLCYSQWQMVYNSETNQTIDALRTDAQDYVMKKAKYLVNNKIRKADIFGYNVAKIWAQSTFELSKSSWNTFDMNPQRMFRVFFDAVYGTVMAVNMDGSRQPVTYTTVNATWYIKNVSESNLCVNSGDATILRSKIETGSDIPYLNTLFISTNSQMIAGELITMVGHRYTSSNYPKYVMPPYWYLLKYTITGSGYVLRWFVGSVSNASVQTAPYRERMCTDDCWVKVFTVGKSGNGIHGSTTQLTQAIRSGHQLRVYVSGVAADTKAVYIHGQTITACLHDIMEPTDVTNFDQSGTAQRKMMSSNGQVQTRKYIFETDTIIEDLQEQQTITWFVDTREWDEVLSVSGDGQNLNGSVADLRQKILLGASVRIVVDHTDGVCLIVDADHMELSPGGHVAADVIYHGNIQIGDTDNITFTPASSYHLWSAIITTEGEFRKYLYTYKRNGGQHKNVSSYVYRYTWFVDI